ncbi:helix-turn-helix transcriptional regulator [Legionella sp. 27fs60]|uniref:Helix-turn-helix transcriptional regulator n=2 Tax=Legionella bononiensis TaxID=2793102 RepID=A0ABS1W9Q5_9GAMM|nr:helix-turn-helix transcriptional regulator [Legionella bononiensis]MBL7526090.1 helix-turn-helix transcriptional regulator [Legionella bononiensis]MBL7563415.1 helix-turn-helix transcriptional regulator [Legionella bononiensis]
MATKILQKKRPLETASMLETICGCKWSMTVYRLLRDGINRPGAMVRSVEGLSMKVLNQCLTKNLEFGILVKNTFPEIPPRVEYTVTNFGEKFLKIIEAIEQLQKEMEQKNEYVTS